MESPISNDDIGQNQRNAQITMPNRIPSRFSVTRDLTARVTPIPLIENLVHLAIKKLTLTNYFNCLDEHILCSYPTVCDSISATQ